MKTRIDPDEFDLSQLQETLDSPGFRLITAKWATTYSVELKKLTTVTSWDNTRYLQGYLDGLQLAAELPGILRTEIKARAAKRRKAAND